MAINEKGESPLTPEDSSVAPNRVTIPERGGRFSWEKFSNGMSVVIFSACWIFFGFVAFQALTGMGIFVVLAVLGGVISGFIASVMIFMMAWSGFSF